MKKFWIVICSIMTVFTLVTFCAVGTWASWYPWPPPADGSAGDVQNAIWGTWIWAVLFPTVLVDAGVAWLGERRKWWD